MTKKLVIVESPSKSKTIEKYLGPDYKVVSSLGHIRDLATTGKFGLGVDLDNDFKPNYVVIKGKNKDVKELKKLDKFTQKYREATLKISEYHDKQEKKMKELMTCREMVTG